MGVRALRRDPGLAAFAILIVGLGVGASATVFSVANALLIRPLPFHDPDRLVFISNGEWDGGDRRSAVSVQLSHMQDLREEGRSFDDVAGYYLFDRPGAHVLTGQGEPQRLTLLRVTDNFFPVLGVSPHIGRFFTPEEVAAAGGGSVVLNHRLWSTRFASDPALVGSTILIDEEPVTVIGVLPPSFDFSSIFEPANSADYVLPFPNNAENERSGNTLALVGRLAPGATIERAQAEAELVVSRREREGRNDFAPFVTPLRERVSGEFRSATLLLVGAVALVMLIVCANLSNLLLSRGLARRQELSIRAALGGSRGRLTRQLLTESLVMAVAGGLVGLAIALGGTRLLARLDVGVALLSGVRVDAAVLGFTLVAAVLTGVLFGVMPALRLSLSSPEGILRERGRGTSGGRGQRRLQSSLVVAEIALACGLLVGSGLLVRSFAGVLGVERGFVAENAVAMRIDPSTPFESEEARVAYLNESIRRVSSAPGVEAVGVTDILPLVSFNRRWCIDRGCPIVPFVRVVTEGYFDALGTDLVTGRDFTVDDDRDAPLRIVLNELTAGLAFPEGGAVGRSVRMNGEDWEVIGVVRPTRHVHLEQEPGPEVFVSMRQIADHASLFLIARGGGSAADLIDAVRRGMTVVNPELPRNDVVSLDGIVREVTSPRRLVLWLMAGFAGFALLMACIGIYGVVSYSVRQRKPEMGIRLALGASPGSLRRRVMRETLALAAAGLAIGLFVAWGLARAMSGLLFGVEGLDAATFGTAAALLLAVAALAGFVPATSAAAADPTETLRAGG